MTYTLKLVYDEDAPSPENNSDDHDSKRVFLVTTINRYFEVRHDELELKGLIRYDGRSIVISPKLKRSHHIYPLNAYIHGGVALSLGTSGQFSDPWDSGQIGYVFVTKKTGEVGDALKAAQGLVEQWNQYLSGDVWGYVILNKSGRTVDSCWGFYGKEYAREEGALALDYVVEQNQIEEQKIERMMHV